MIPIGDSIYSGEPWPAAAGPAPAESVTVRLFRRFRPPRPRERTRRRDRGTPGVTDR